MSLHVCPSSTAIQASHNGQRVVHLSRSDTVRRSSSLAAAAAAAANTTESPYPMKNPRCSWQFVNKGDKAELRAAAAAAAAASAQQQTCVCLCLCVCALCLLVVVHHTAMRNSTKINQKSANQPTTTTITTYYSTLHTARLAVADAATHPSTQICIFWFRFRYREHTHGIRISAANATTIAF